MKPTRTMRTDRENKKRGTEMETTKRQKPWRAVLLRILGYVAIMSGYENVVGRTRTEAGG